MKRRVVTVIIERDPGGGFVASVVELPACHTQGETMDELRAHVREAVELYVKDEDLADPMPEFVGIERIEVSH
ncbi:MAG TPA: type II toxin-antitoxin system HicB family antitoxin [Candidatus Thermoplasmatota archaeon]|nr:type II toxin-antitoxin system HicB family antitoxin [Candidatus Thermoplasmatota archaeon]